MTPEQPATARPVRRRSIRPEDAAAVQRLLASGFPQRTAAYWATAVGRLFERAGALGVSPGVVLVCEDALVGVILLIPGGEAAAPRLNLSSWYVDPGFAAYAPLITSRALGRKDVTYINVSPAPHTWATIEAQGFVRYSRGRIAALPALMGWARGVRVRAFDPAAHAALSQEERDLLLRHVGYGCLAIVAETPAGLHPFLFLPWRIKHRVPGAQLVWCRAIDDLVRVGGAVGRHLLRRGMPVVLVDACGPVEGLPGSRIEDRSPKYAKGPHPPRTGDLTDTELVMFGP